jgi:chemotaxis protein methyltransferase WspC
MTQVAIEALLRQKIGLDASSIGSSTIARAIRRRMADCGLADMATYLHRLQTSTQEWEELIETVIVPETWFFRDREPFAFLAGYVMSERWPKHSGRVLRVLSVPCSTGEEPYSIAIALIEAGLASKNFRIDAVDISKQSLLKAKRAVYGNNSFRGTDLALRERYFEQTEAGFALRELVSSTVNFIHGNLLDGGFLVDKDPYDVIFCRNLLIYFDRSGREQAIQMLDRLLAQKGLLFVGHAEAGQILASRFVPVRHPLAFAYRKVEQQGSRAAGERVRIFTPSHPSPLAPSTSRPFTSYPTPQRPHSPTQSSLLETARVLADRGQLDEAATLCETYLSQNRVSAEAYVLLGQVRQAMGNNAQAEQCFHKAIYLEPKHYEALIHLAFLKEHLGDIANAAVIRQRIQRLQTFQ